MSQRSKDAKEESRRSQLHKDYEDVILQVETFVQLTSSGASNMVRRMSTLDQSKIKYQGQAMMRIEVPNPGGPPKAQNMPFEFDLPDVTSIQEAFDRFEECATAHMEKQKQLARLQMQQQKSKILVPNNKGIVGGGGVIGGGG